MPRFLIFRLAGPLASWGDVAVGSDRHSAPYPGRSALLGLLASALGIRRVDERKQRELAAGYRFAVVLCKPGELLRDYHTTQVPSSTDAKGWPLVTRRDELAVVEWAQRSKGKAGEAILSYRDYRCDGLWMVAVQPTDDAPFPLDELREALLRPRFCLFLGRKACPPSFPLEPQVVAAPTLFEALQKVEFHGPAHVTRVPSGRPASRGNAPLLYWEAGIDAGFEPQQSGERWDDPLSRSKWLFRPRLENHASLPGEVLPCI